MFNATFIVAGISFVIFTIIMNAIFYAPLEKIVNERQKFIEDTNEEAKLNREKSSSILKDRDEKISTTKQKAKKILSDSSDASKKVKVDMTRDARNKAIIEINVAKDSLNKEKSDAQNVLADNVVNLAQNISSKLLGENISTGDTDREMINNIMGEGE